MPHGQHAQRREPGRVLSSWPLCEGLVLFLGLARLARWAGSEITTGASWLLLTGTGAALCTGALLGAERSEDAAGARLALAAAVACYIALTLLEIARALVRRAARQQWRQAGGRPTPQGPLTPQERAYQFSRLDRLEAVIADRAYHIARVAVLEEQFSALMCALEASYQIAGEPAGGAPGRHLRVVADDDTTPFGAAG